jgi:hypothetical protein
MSDAWVNRSIFAFPLAVPPENTPEWVIQLPIRFSVDPMP